MRILKSAGFDEFRCIAGACPDSCCKEWSVQVDPEAAAYYRSIPGALGDRLRQVLTDEDGETVMVIEDGRCPMWRQDGLCRIQFELGEEALCRTCREFPRLTHDYGDFKEYMLELSCPEAAHMILTENVGDRRVKETPEAGEPGYDEEAMTVLLQTRETMLALLADTTRPVGETLALALLYGCQAQGELDGGQVLPFDADAALETIHQLQKPGDAGAVPGFYLTLEILTDAWRQRLLRPEPGEWHDGYRKLARYFVERYWLQAVADYDLYSRVKFTLVSCLLIKLLGGDFVETAQLYSKEIENSAENVDALLDAMYEAAAFTDDKLLGLLMKP